MKDHRSTGTEGMKGSATLAVLLGLKTYCHKLPETFDRSVRPAEVNQLKEVGGNGKDMEVALSSV
jgi:hypothetical protein